MVKVHGTEIEERYWEWKNINDFAEILKNARFPSECKNERIFECVLGISMIQVPHLRYLHESPISPMAKTEPRRS